MGTLARVANGLRCTSARVAAHSRARATWLHDRCVRDLALDPVTGDLALDTGRASLTSGVGAKAQRLKLRLQLQRGEYRLDLRQGVPYLSSIFGKGTRAAAETILRRAVSTSPGIAAIEQWQLDLGADREARLTLRARTIDGEPIELDAFRWEGR